VCEYTKDSVYERYQGEWRDDKREGKGVSKKKDGKVSFGRWRDDDLIIEEDCT
jgi:MORN repeat